MIVINDKPKCNGCHGCYSICPAGCIEMVADSEGFLYPSVDASKCIDCGECERVCPVLNGKCDNPDSLKTAYAAYCNDERVRSDSSSGGIFTLISQSVIQAGGTVFGAGLSSDFSAVCHNSADDLNRLGSFRGSKYIQSAVGDSFKSVKQLLESGKPVLFSGTPCQIGGLYSFLGRDYDKLFTQDIICHGVPSQKVWSRYLAEKESAYNSEATDVSFRSKENGWKHYSVRINFSDGERYLRGFREDTYMRGFLANLYLRPSCHDCRFKTAYRQADITLADFWGIQSVLPEMDNDGGTSLVLVNSEKGAKLFSQIKDGTTCEKVDFDTALSKNSSAVKCAEKHAKREAFFDAFDKNGDVEKLIEKCIKEPFGLRIKKKLGRIKHSLIKG